VEIWQFAQIVSGHLFAKEKMMIKCRIKALRKSNRYFLGVILSSLLLLNGCDNSSNQSVSTDKTSSQKTNTDNANIKHDSNSLAELAKRDAGKRLSLLDASEVQLDGASTLVMTFSIPLDPNQNFSSVVHLVDSKDGKVDGAWELSDKMTELRLRHLLPNRKLNLTIDADIKAINGATLGAENQQVIKTSNIEPRLGFVSKGSLLPTRVAEGLPVMALNIDKVDVNFYRIKTDSLPDFLSEWQAGRPLDTWDADSKLKHMDLVYTGRFVLNPQLNTSERLLLPINNIDALKQPGVYFAVMQQAGHYSDSNPATMFTLSDIGVSLHRYNNRMDVYTQKLADGSVLKNVDLLLLDDKGKQLQQVKTDGDGHAQLDKNDKASLLIAQQDGQTTMLDLSKAALDLSEFDVAGKKGYNQTFFMFGPRDLYRPGETVLLNGLLRDADGKVLPPQPVKAVIVNPEGQVQRSFVWQPIDGLYQYKLPISDAAATGEWSVRVNVGDNQPRNYHFRIEDFMPERMALDILGSKQPLSMDQPASFKLTGRYLYGAPAAGNHVTGTLTMSPLREAVSKLPGYEFGDIKVNVDVDSSWDKLHSPIQLLLQASLQESGGRPVTRRFAQPVWPAETMVGIRPLFKKQQVYDYRTDSSESRAMVDENSMADFDIVYANVAGKKLAAQGLQVRLINERRDYFWSWSNQSGWESNYNQKDLSIAEQRVDIAADGTAHVSFPVEWGSYRLEVEDPQTHLVSSYRFWAGYSWQDNTDGSGAVRPDQVKLKLDKPAYQPGERAKVHIEAPAAGKGYLMVESSDGPLWWQEVDVPEKGTDVDVPINAQWNRHDLYFTAMVVRPGDKKLQSTPKRAVGVLNLPLAEENRHLTVQLEAPQKIRPNQTVAIKVKANINGQPASGKVTVLLSAADSGVLSITDFQTPDPYDAFLGRKRYGTDQYDVYGQLIEGKGRLATFSFGGDGDDGRGRGGKKPVTKVHIVAQQQAPVVLNDQGEGTIELPVPDFNGQLRLMAQAWSDTAFGNGETKMLVAAPMVVELSTPRFMGSGDTSMLALDLTNLSGQPQTLNVNFSANKLISLDNAQNSSSVTLNNGQRRTLTIPVKALNGFGQGDVQVLVTGMKLPNETFPDYHRSWTIGVRPAFSAENRHYDAVVKAGESWSLPADATSDLNRDSLQANLLVSSEPPLDLARYISELFAYPYGCLEQTTSGLYPSLYANSLQLRAWGIKTNSDEERHNRIDVGIARLLGMQKENGGFGLWSNTSDEEYWLTAYVTDFLVRATEQGYSVSSDSLSKANKRLQRYLQDGTQIQEGDGDFAEASRFAVQAYAGLVLARQHQAPLGSLRELFDKRDKAQSGLSLVQLGVALKLMGDEPRAEKAISAGMAKKRTSAWLHDYGSEIRDNAQILSLLTENNLLQDKQEKLMFSLSETLNGHRWLSTQESNSLFLAGRGVMAKAQTPWQVTLDGQSQAQNGTAAWDRHFNDGQLQQGVGFHNTGNSTVYARFNLVGYPTHASAPVSNKLHISREFLGLDGKPAAMESLKSGQLVLVHLDVYADEGVPDALVVDMLPAGLELENQNLSNSSASLTDASNNVQELLMNMREANIKHQEFRDDRYVAAVSLDSERHMTLLYLARAVTPGSYNVPAPQIESMYAPDWRATGQTPQQMNIR